MKIIVARCPICGTQKNEILTEELIELRKSIDKGLVGLRISENVVCEHSFYIELDRNYNVRNAYPEDQYKHQKKREKLPAFKNVRQLLDYFMVKS